MNGEQKSTASDRLASHLENIDNYVNLTNAKFSSFKEEYLLVSNFPNENLKNLTQQECFDSAYLLYGYASYIQDEINKNKIVLSWCNDQLEKLVVSHNEEFNQYTKHEVKRQTIIKDNTYAAKVDQMRMVAESRLTALDGKVYEIKRKADILLERGKRS